MKRQREARKAEKAAAKREKRELREPAPDSESHVATKDELAGYGFPVDEQEPEPEEP